MKKYYVEYYKRDGIIARGNGFLILEKQKVCCRYIYAEDKERVREQIIKDFKKKYPTSEIAISTILEIMKINNPIDEKWNIKN